MTEINRELNRRMLDNLRDDRTDLADSEVRIPANAFTCPDLLQQERRALFHDTPQPVAFSGELPGPNTFIALQVLDTPVLLTRNKDGLLHAFINACAHRGAPVAAGAGSARSLVCAFHGWAYNLEGGLRGRPGESNFDSGGALVSLPVSERYGVVVIALDPQLPQDKVDQCLDDIGEQLEALTLAAYRPLERRRQAVAANWKLVNDLSLESYHFKTLHRDSVAELMSPSAVVDTYGQHSRWAFPLKAITALSEQPEEQWPNELQGSCTYTLYPGVMLLINSLGAQMIRAEPGDAPGESFVSYIGVHGPGCDPDAALQAYIFGGEVFETEDLPMAEACQQGITATQRDLPLGRNEPLLQFWHQLWHAAVK